MILELHVRVFLTAGALTLPERARTNIFVTYYNKSCQNNQSSTLRQCVNILYDFIYYVTSGVQLIHGD